MIDLCLGADDELMKKEAKDWRRGERKEAIKEEKGERIKRQAERGAKRGKSRRRSRRDQKRRRRGAEFDSISQTRALIILITFESN